MAGVALALYKALKFLYTFRSVEQTLILHGSEGTVVAIVWAPRRAIITECIILESFTKRNVYLWMRLKWSGDHLCDIQFEVATKAKGRIFEFSSLVQTNCQLELKIR